MSVLDYFAKTCFKSRFSIAAFALALSLVKYIRPRLVKKVSVNYSLPRSTTELNWTDLL